MPRKSAIEKKWNEVATILAKRDTEGKIKCSIYGCTEDGRENLVIHHRFEPAYIRGNQYKRLQTCEENPENCEILCKRHARILDKALMELEEQRLSGSPLIPDKKTVKEMILEFRKKIEYKATHFEEFDFEL